MISVNVIKPLTIRYNQVTATELRQLGAAGLQTMLGRVGAIRNVRDQAARPYSSRGPIYVPNTGVQGRSKWALSGREVLTSADRTAIRKAGRGSLMGKTRGGKTTRFENYAAYKRALGKSGQRDLELSGRMLGSLGIVRLTENSVVIGFTREEEHQKAMGNQTRDEWFGLSGKDQEAVIRRAAVIIKPRIAAD